MTIIGLPINSASLNFTPGDASRRSSSMTVIPFASRELANFSAVSNGRSSLPVATICTFAGAISNGQTKPNSSWLCSATAATARETPIP